jgi:hypothetical protein
MRKGFARVHIRPNFIAAAAFAIVLCSATDSSAHHSRVNFDLESVVELSGTVIRWQYRNPHVFLHLDVVNDSGDTVRWVVELGSIVNLKQIDMHRDTLQPGDKVAVVANPEKVPKNNYVFFKSLTKADGTEYRFSDVFAYSRNAAADEKQPGSTDFTGIWDEVATPLSTLVTAGPPDYPVTEAGREVLDRYNPDEEPGNTCGEDGLPKLIRSFYAIEITRDEQAIYMEYEFYGVRRIVHMNMSEHPRDIVPSDYGHSIGRMEGDILVVDTTGFAPAKWGIGDGLDSSARKHVEERYELKDNGHIMEITYTVTDPVYLKAPFSRTHTKRYVPGYVITPYEACDPDTARLHLEIEKQ